MIKLGKLSKELGVNISKIIDFLQSQGYEITADHNYKISPEIQDLISKNIGTNREVEIQNSVTFADLPLSIRIAQTLKDEKKLTERLIGYTSYQWQYFSVSYNGICSKPIPFTLFDEVICDILQIEELSLVEIGKILGFDISIDLAEKQILLKAIESLKKDKMIEGDESLLCLTETGKEYAKNGAKYSTFTKDFELYFDTLSDNLYDAKDIFSKLKSEKLSENIPFNEIAIDTIKLYAEIQAPEIHFPEKNYLLKEAKLISKVCMQSEIYVCFLENFENQTTRALVFDHINNRILYGLSEIINTNEELKSSLLQVAILNDSEISEIEIEKSFEQKNTETNLILKQSEVEEAQQNNDIDKITEIIKEFEESKRSFDSLEFELELKRLFYECDDELWLISPWIKDTAFNNRLPFIEAFLKKGGKVFIAYSEPENDELMVSENPMKKMKELENTYFNFYFTQLPPFHYKNVLAKFKSENHLEYSGSFNVMSFFVNQNQKYVRKEEMIRLIWNEETEEKYELFQSHFCVKYLNQCIEGLNKLIKPEPHTVTKEFLQELKSYSLNKIKYFETIDNEDILNKIEEIELTKNDNYQLFREKYYLSEISIVQKNIQTKLTQKISEIERRDFYFKINKLKDVAKEYKKVQDIIKDSEILLSKIQVFKTNSTFSNPVYHKPAFKRK